MKKTFENKLSMYLTVQTVCDENNSVWTGIAACSSAINEFKDVLADIVEARQVQESSHTGVTEDKLARQEAMANNAMVVKGAVQAYATDSNNNELYKSVNYSMTAIKKQADTIARDRALLIFNKATTISSQLGDYALHLLCSRIFKQPLPIMRI